MVKNIKKIVTGELNENAYVVDDGKVAFVVDPGADYEKIRTACDCECVAVLLTHAHFDHIGAAAAFQKAGAKIYISETDSHILHTSGNLAAAFGIPLEEFDADILVHDADSFDIGDMEIRVLSTPGHTAGGVCYIADDAVFTGDTLFRLDVGRSDFPTGSADELADSIANKIFALDGEYTLYPGHGDITTLSFERKNNPYRIYLCR